MREKKGARVLYQSVPTPLVGIAVDGLGNVQVTEYPGQHQVIHRPLEERPHRWDMGHDGYTLYNTIGGAPEARSCGGRPLSDRIERAGVGSGVLTRPGDY